MGLAGSQPPPADANLGRKALAVPGEWAQKQGVIAVGTTAPPFSGTDQRGAPISLEGLRAVGPVVLYFYPHDFTLGCTRQACMFRDAFEDLSGLGASIVGVSVDDEHSHRSFAREHRLPLSLLRDADHALARAYGVLRVLGLGVQRATFVIDQAGVVQAAIHSELSMSRHVDDTRRVLTRLTRTAQERP
jgi:peroxiredoxin Q/BCP